MMHVITSAEKTLAMKSFAGLFNEYYVPGAEFIEIDEFLRKYSDLIPMAVKRILYDEQNGKSVNCYFNWSQTFHFNAS